MTDKPSIAVLPFVNMSGDPEQEFFADGLTEDIITALSRFRDLFVISRNSAFVYKNRAVRIQEVAAEFGVQYVVEGSVRKAGNRVRVTVQLIDAESDRHVWAERYDRELEDIFAIQDEVTAAIVATLPGRVEAASHDRAKRKPTDNLAAYECVLAGKVLHHRSTREDNAEAQRVLERAIALDPSTPMPTPGWDASWSGVDLRLVEDRDATFRRIGEELQIAQALDENDSDLHRIFAGWNLVRGDHERALYHQERALALNPNNDLIVVQQGELLTWLGRPEEGIDGSGRRCASTRTIPSATGAIWAARISWRSATPRRSRRSPGSAGPITRITRSWPRPARRSAMIRGGRARRGGAQPAARVRGGRLSGDPALQARERPRPPSGGLLKAGLPP